MYKWNLRLCRRLLWRRFHVPQWVHYPVSFYDFPKHRTWGLSLGLEEEGHSQVTVEIFLKIVQMGIVYCSQQRTMRIRVEFIWFWLRNQFLLLINRLRPSIHQDSVHSKAARITFNLDRSLSDAECLLPSISYFYKKYAQILFWFFILFAWRIVFKESLQQIFTCSQSNDYTKAQVRTRWIFLVQMTCYMELFKQDYQFSGLCK